ncbi:uncharacterized protein DFE_2020 [Desulfovibrio ferrophilus]|uniref:N-acetyltransferase domain-containing protein n=2 Tax=Desulfovibrio ferrophilus TaxID=241368 RepID=A0A2Z6B043_9BACT|nr:uncharacterized protein DFE_2020 [Desulfovibrio ferrophilus]
MRLVPFEPAHLERLELREFDRLGVVGLGDGRDLGRLAEFYARSGPAFTVLVRGCVAACAGVAVQPGATGNAWMFSGTLIGEQPVAVARAIRRGLEDIECEHGLTRIQTTAHHSLDLPPRWYAFLGFSREGLLRRLVGDDDYYLYARVR